MRALLLIVLLTIFAAPAGFAIEPALRAGGHGPVDPVPTGRSVVAWSQPANLNGLLVSSEANTQLGLTSEVANDFILAGPAPVAMISRVRWWGGYYNYTLGDPLVPSFTLTFYRDGPNCTPGPVLARYVVCDTTDVHARFLGNQAGVFPLYEYEFAFQLLVTTNTRYWFCVRAGDHTLPPQWGRLEAVPTLTPGCQSTLRSAFFGFPNWTPASVALGQSQLFEASFELETDNVYTPGLTEVITILSGQVNREPGTVCNAPDDGFTFTPSGPLGLVPFPFPPRPFNVGDFWDACNSQDPARLVTSPVAAWARPSGAFSDARWINYDPNSVFCHGEAGSVLYCYQFNVETPCDPVADICACWAVDDCLGDPPNAPYGQPNPIGLYLNDQPVSASFQGGGFGSMTCATASGVLLQPGLNTLHLYQRDIGGSRGGILFGCTMKIQGQSIDVAGRKIKDVNCDGMFGAGDSPLSNWTIVLTGDSKQTSLTGPVGDFSFNGIYPRVYELSEVTKPGWIQCRPIGGIYRVPGYDCQNLDFDFFNCPCDSLEVCAGKPPASMSCWYDFDDGSGSTAEDVAGGLTATFAGGSPNWVADGCGVGTYAVSLLSASSGYLTAASGSLQNDFSTGSFSVLAWVEMDPTSASDNLQHTIVDKRVKVGATGERGYRLFLHQGRLYCTVGNGGPPVTYPASGTGPVVPTSTWVQVGATVCRSAPCAGDKVVLYVGTTGSNVGSGCAIPNGLQNSAQLHIGNQCSGFTQTIPFKGKIGDLMFFGSCLNSATVASVVSNHCLWCRNNVYIPSVVSGPGSGQPWNTAKTEFRLCNYSHLPATYQWTIAGTPACVSPPFGVGGPTTYSVYSGQESLVPPVHCKKVSVTMNYPPGFGLFNTACYQVTVKNLTTNRCFSGQGKLRRPFVTHWSIDGLYLALTPLHPGLVRFGLRNDGDSTVVVPYRFSSRSADGDSTNLVVALNGGALGDVVDGELFLASGDSTILQVQVELQEFQPLNLNEVVLSVDWDQDGEYEAAAVVALESVAEGNPASEVLAPVGAGALGPVALRLSTAPNPFQERTGIRFELPTARVNVLVRVFDVGGRIIRALHEGPMAAGTHELSWDGLDGVGRRSGSGIFFIQVESEGEVLKSKVMRLE